jgi:ssDNA-binding replication factor A large subunit
VSITCSVVALVLDMRESFCLLLTSTAFQRYDQSSVSKQTGVLADKTGSVEVCFWAEHSDTTTEGQSYKIENAVVRQITGNKGLSVGRTTSVQGLDDVGAM